MKDLPKNVGDPDCEMCSGSGVINEGVDGEYEEVPCPCTISEPADFSGATEGDR